MTYCAICGRQHDPDLPCSDGAHQVLRDAGMDGTRQIPGPEMRKIVRLADKWMLKLLLAILALLGAIAVLTAILDRRSS